MELQENGLPLDAVFVGILLPQTGQWYWNGARFVESQRNWNERVSVIRFPTYGKPLEQVDLKGRKLLGGSMATAWRSPKKGDFFVGHPYGYAKEALCDFSEQERRICLEPLLKKRRVLVVEIPVTESDTVNLRTGPREFDYSVFSLAHLMKFAGGTIKEVDDEA